MRKESITLSIPKYLKEAIEELPNKSEVLSLIFEENADRILSGDLAEATNFRKLRAKELILSTLSTNRKEAIKLDEINNILKNLKEMYEVANKLKIEIRNIERTIRNLTVELRSQKYELDSTLSSKLNEIIEQFSEEFELE